MVLLARQTTAWADTATTGTNSTPRDPFWPVGYSPAKPSASGSSAMPEHVITEDDWRQAQKRLVTSSVFRAKDPATGTDRFLALINGKVVTPGETLVVKHRDFTFRFKAANISADGVQFERMTN